MNGNDSLMLPDNFAKRKEFTKVLMSMRKPDDKGSLDEENFNEAKTNLIKSFGSCKVRLEELLKIGQYLKLYENFWNLARLTSTHL